MPIITRIKQTIEMLSFFLFWFMGFFVIVSWVFASLLLLANLGYFRTLFINFMTFFVSSNDKISEMRTDKAFRFIF